MATLTEGLVSHYLLGNNAKDCYGANDGTNNGVTFDGEKGTFDGVTDNIIIPSVPVTIAGGYAYSFWISRSSEGDKVILDYDNPSGTHFLSYIDNVKIYYVATTNYQGYAVIEHTLGSTFATQHHIFIVRTANGNNLDIYIDGVQKTVSFGGTLDNVDSKVGVIGNRYADDTHTFDGDISNVRIYNETKDSTFAMALYNEGSHPNPILSSVEVTATATAYANNPLRSTASIEVTATATATAINPSSTASIEVTATATPITLHWGAAIATTEVTATATAIPLHWGASIATTEVTTSAKASWTIGESSLFTFIQEIEQLEDPRPFHFVQAIASTSHQAKIIVRINE